MEQKDEILEMTTYKPHEDEQKDKWIFPDSENIPSELTFAGQVQKRSSTGIMIPCLKFREQNGTCWYLSLWSKPVVKLELLSGSVCKVYLNTNKKIEVLKLD